MGKGIKMKHYRVECWKCRSILELPLRIPDTVALQSENPHKTFFQLKCPKCGEKGKYSLSTFVVVVGEKN